MRKDWTLLHCCYWGPSWRAWLARAERKRGDLELGVELEEASSPALCIMYSV